MYEVCLQPNNLCLNILSVSKSIPTKKLVNNQFGRYLYQPRLTTEDL